MNRAIYLATTLPVLFAAAACAEHSQSPWWNAAWSSRISIAVRAAGYQRRDKPVEVELDFAAPAGRERPAIEPKSFRLVEVTATGAIKEADVPFQFDPAEGFDGAARSAGSLTFVLKEHTPANAVRRYHLYFGNAGAAAADAVPQIALEESVSYEGQDSFKIATPAATYFYHKQGAGFASMIDNEGQDWIGYNPGVGEKSKSGSGGMYRGIPNLGHPEGYCHPGKEVSQSRIVARGPLRVSILSESSDGKMRCRWDIFPNYARLTMLAMLTPYWFLYEGTPGGQLDLETDVCVRPNGAKLLRTKAGERWDGDIVPSGEPGEWVHFADGLRAVYLVQHEDDEAIDSYWPMNAEMTVFGFGRQKLQEFLDQVPAQFTIGLCDGKEEQLVEAIRSAYTPLEIVRGAIESSR